MKLTLAFYVGRGNCGDRAIRMATRSIFSHVELLAPYEGARGKHMLSISSSPRDGGVREKLIDFNPSRWTFVDLEPWHQDRAYETAFQYIGQRYDWTAIAFTFALGFGCHSRHRMTCSELIANALGFEADSHMISPGGLYHQCTRLNAAYQKGSSTPL